MFPGYDPFWTVVYLLAILFLMIWGLICKSRSYWWLFLVVPIPLAYFILKNKSPREVVLE